MNPANAEAISKAWRATVWAACVAIACVIEPIVPVAAIVCGTFLLARQHPEPDDEAAE